MNRIAVWGGSFWMVLFLFCLPALEVLPVWKIIVYHYGWKVREKFISSSYSRGDILVLYQAIKSWDTAYLGGALLDAAITAVEAVCFLAATTRMAADRPRRSALVAYPAILERALSLAPRPPTGGQSVRNAQDPFRRSAVSIGPAPA